MPFYQLSHWYDFFEDSCLKMPTLFDAKLCNYTSNKSWFYALLLLDKLLFVRTSYLIITILFESFFFVNCILSDSVLDNLRLYAANKITSAVVVH